MAIEESDELKQLVDRGMARGHVLFKEISQLLPEDYDAELDKILRKLKNAGIEILEEPRSQFDEKIKGDEFIDQNLDQDFSGEMDFDDPVEVYLREVSKVRPLTRDAEIELVKRIERGNQEGKAAERTLIEANLRLVVVIAQRYVNRGVHLLSLIEEGNTGLMKAVKRFNYTSGYEFPTYAKWWVLQAIIQTIRYPEPTPPHLVPE